MKRAQLLKRGARADPKATLPPMRRSAKSQAVAYSRGLAFNRLQPSAAARPGPASIDASAASGQACRRHELALALRWVGTRAGPSHGVLPGQTRRLSSLSSSKGYLGNVG